MRSSLYSVFTIVIFSTIGCSGSSSTGGGTPGTPVSASPAKETFTIHGPILEKAMRQGERRNITLNLDRGSEFKRSVKLEAHAPNGVKATLSPTLVKSSEPSEILLTLEVDKSAAIGEHKIVIIASPETGNEARLDLKIKIEEGK